MIDALTKLLKVENEYEIESYFTWIPLFQSTNQCNFLLDDESYPKDVMVVNPSQSSKLRSFFERESKGESVISISTAIQVARKCGYAPSKIEENNLEEQFGLSVTLEQLDKWVRTIPHTEDTLAYLIKIFEQYDVGKTGKLDIKQFVNIVTEMPILESLSKDECQNLLSIIPGDNKNVDYVYLSKKILDYDRQV